MGRARKLLEKTNKLQNKVRRTASFITDLYSNPDIFDIIKEKPRTADDKGVNNNGKIKGFSTTSVSIARVDFEFPYESYGIELVLPPGIITTSSIRSGDEVEIMGGVLEGRSLEVIGILNSNSLRLDDVSTFNQQESNIPIKFILNSKE